MNDKDQKISNPSAFFKRPKDVLQDKTLSKNEKRKALKSMEIDADLLSEAAAENMAGGESPQRRDEIEKALQALDDDNIE